MHPVTKLMHRHFDCVADLTDILAKSTDYNELVWAWKGWRDESGKKMKSKYKEFVDLSNEAARENGKFHAQLVLKRDLILVLSCPNEIREQLDYQAISLDVFIIFLHIIFKST